MYVCKEKKENKTTNFHFVMMPWYIGIHVFVYCVVEYHQATQTSKKNPFIKDDKIYILLEFQYIYSNDQKIFQS